MQTRTATFAMGCFWEPEDFFSGVDGVVSTRVGYSGGETENPSYHDLDGHTETVEITYDPERIGYEQLLEHFWTRHDSTGKHKTQYASIIFYHDDEQKELAERSREDRRTRIKGLIQTDIRPADEFYPAETYHQKYLAKRRGET